MAYRLKTVEQTQLTRELAIEFATARPFDGERPVKESRLAYLEDELRIGRWTLCEWATCEVLELGQTFRVNGQHSSRMLAYCNEDIFPNGSVVLIHRYECDHASDMAAVFDLFDNPKSARSTGDKFAFYYGQHKDLPASHLLLADSITHGVARYHADQVRNAKRNKEVVAVSDVFAPRERGIYLTRAQVRSFLLWTFTLSRTRLEMVKKDHFVDSGRLLSVAEVTEAMYGDFLKAPDVAQVFWNQVFTADNPDGDHPTRELHADLQRLYERKKTRSTAVPIGQFLRLCGSQFRKFRKYEKPTETLAA